ncbi:hypothetical protein [Streptomyces sp. NPDC001933]|uniref:hypothetical protein n=1 Tax=Streptomyces sp. NPDC001933 TaxID=3364626 RepID=UPI0036C64059
MSGQTLSGTDPVRTQRDHTTIEPRMDNSERRSNCNGSRQMPPITFKAASGKALADTEIHLDRDFDGKG